MTSVRKTWKYLPNEECEFCGGSVEIYNEYYLEEGYGYDGDSIRCNSCNTRGYWSVDADEGSGWCHSCDSCLVGDGEKCPVCGARNGKNRLKKE